MDYDFSLLDDELLLPDGRGIPVPPIAPVETALPQETVQPPLDLTAYDAGAVLNARKERDQEINNANLMEAISGFGQALGRSNQPADNKYFDDLRKNAQTRAKESIDLDQNRQKAVVEALKQKRADERARQVQAKMDERFQFMKDRAAKTDQRFNEGLKLRQSAQDSRDLRVVMSAMNNKSVKDEEAKIRGAAAGQALLDKIKTNRLTPSKNVRNQLTNLITLIEFGSPGAVEDRKKMGVDSLYTTAMDALTFASGNPQNSIPENVLKQLETEIHALGERAGKSYRNATEAIVAGQNMQNIDPNADMGNVARLTKARRDAFLTENGFDPQTGKFKSAPIKEGQTATNPKTGQKLIFKGGKWQPM